MPPYVGYPNQLGVLDGYVHLPSSFKTSLQLTAVQWILRVVRVSLDNHSVANRTRVPLLGRRQHCDDMNW
jgi:hypothetical protein